MLKAMLSQLRLGFLLAGWLLPKQKVLNGRSIPLETAHGALLSHITGGAMVDSFQPMNVNFGLFPELPLNEKGRRPRGRDRKAAHAQRALKYMAELGVT